jgi:putative FmdB family regulatory protein
MPTYEYKCSACGEQFEKFQSIMAPPIKKCPACGRNKAQRLISAGAGLIFKGSGFYITDYRDSGYKDQAKADTAASGDKPADAKTDAKPSTDTAAATSSSDASASKAEAPKPAAKPESKAESKPAARSDSRKSKKS